MTNPQTWIEGTEEVRIAYPTETRQAVFFVGRSKSETRFALAGSSAHLISRGDAKTTDVGWSFLPDLMMQLRSMIFTFENPRIEEGTRDTLLRTAIKNMEFEWIDLVSVLEKQAPGPPMKVSFLAKRLLAGSHENLGFNTVLATPLYVAMDT